MAGIDPTKCKVFHNRALAALEKAGEKQNLWPEIRTIGPHKMFKIEGQQTPFRLVTWDGGEKQMMSEATLGSLVYHFTGYAANILGESLVYDPLGISATRGKTGTARKTSQSGARRSAETTH